MINSQILSAAAIDACTAISIENGLPPHSLGIAAAKGQEFLHQGSRRFHEKTSGITSW
jgi:hypothetical protein